MRTAVIIEAQTLFIPFLEGALKASGLRVIASGAEPSACDLARAQPDVVFIDAHCLRPAPLRTLRAVRDAAPAAHIVLYVPAEDPAWSRVAVMLGAGTILGSRRGGVDLADALALLAAA